MTNCTSVYAPQTLNTPLFTKAGEFQGSIKFGLLSVKGQAAVAVTNHFALMVNGSNANYTKGDQYLRQNLYEGALGYYTNHKTKLVSFEVFFGYGRGEGSFHDYVSGRSDVHDDRSQKGKYVRYIFQPTIGFGFNQKKRVQLAFTPRISYVDFTELTTINYQSTNNLTFNSTTTNPDPLIFFEPAVTSKFNFLDNRLFTTLQLGGCVSNGGGIDGDKAHVVTYFPFNFSIGLGFRLGGLRWSKQE